MTPVTSSDESVDTAAGTRSAESQATAYPLLLCLPALPPEAVSSTLRELAMAFPGESVVLARADAEPESAGGSETLIYGSPRSQLGWVLVAGDYAAAATVVGDRTFSGVILMGTETISSNPDLLHGFAAQLHAGADLVLPRFTVGPHDGLVNSALLYPMTRALFGVDVRFPLPIDVALSPRMLQRLASGAQRQMGDGLIWPVPEAASAGYATREVQAGPRSLPLPTESDLNKLLTGVASSLFLDVEAKASFWQRARSVSRGNADSAAATVLNGSSDASEDVAEIVANFRLAYANLLEIWSLVLPPQTLLALKKLSVSDPSAFVFQPELWARIVYDFALAFHLRTLNRGHLLGALTPIYLAWVASHVRAAGDDARVAADLVEGVAAAFEREKPYLVARWRWPDRFNP